MHKVPYLSLSIALTLGIIAIIGMVGLIRLSLARIAPDPALVAAVSGCIGSLSSLLLVAGGKNGNGSGYYPYPPSPNGRPQP